MARAPISPENCPTPAYHETFRYCPTCTWTYDDEITSAKERMVEDNDRHGYSQPTLAQYDQRMAEIRRLRAALTEVCDIAYLSSTDLGRTIAVIGSTALRTEIKPTSMTDIDTAADYAWERWSAEDGPHVTSTVFANAMEVVIAWRKMRGLND